MIRPPDDAPRMRGAAPLVLLLAALAAGCDTFDAQQTFRVAAFGAPSGIYSTDASGNPLPDAEADADDWRTGPAYAIDPQVRVLARAYPNPVRYGEPVTVVVRVTGTLAGGLYLRRYPPRVQDEAPLAAIGLAGPLLTGSYELSFNAGQLDPTGQGGLFRVILVDDRFEPVSYGDVRVLP